MEVCKSTIALYGLYVNVIKSECVTSMLINPIVPTRTRHFSRVYRPTRHTILQSFSWSRNYETGMFITIRAHIFGWYGQNLSSAKNSYFRFLLWNIVEILSRAWLMWRAHKYNVLYSTPCTNINLMQHLGNIDSSHDISAVGQNVAQVNGNVNSLVFIICALRHFLTHFFYEMWT
jgi:hypothetical protein